MTFFHKTTRRIYINNIPIGNNAPIAIQSMTKTNTHDVQATLKQIKRLAQAGCEIIRCAVPDLTAALALKSITANSPLPIIADVHFDSTIAILALKHGAAALRINPGNISKKIALDRIVDMAKDLNKPIRIGVNSGSLSKKILNTYNGPSPKAIVQAALNHIHYLESRSFYNIKVSLKSSNVLDTITAYRHFSKICNYPLHLGITEAGGLLSGITKSAIAISILLLEGIGDTIRISLTTDPIYEVKTAWHILRACGLRKRGVEIISCPTCGRTKIDLIKLLKLAELKLSSIQTPLKVAIMGCIVNGPGEARHADVGIAGGNGQGIIFAQGKIIRKVAESELFTELIKEIKQIEHKYKKNKIKDKICATAKL